MPNDYSQVVLPELLLNFDEIFAKQRHDEFMGESPITAATLLERQTARFVPILVNGRCTGFSVAYLKADDDTIDDGVGTVPAAECVITPDQTFSGLKEDYEISRWFTEKPKVPTKDCDSAIKTRERISYQIAASMQKIALKLNQHAINVLLSNKQTATNVGNWGLNIVGGVIEYAKSDLLDQQQFQSILNDWYMIGQQEFLSAGMFAVNGTNWFTQYRDAVANANNDNMRSQLITFGAIPMANDIHGFGISRANIIDTSFLVDPNSYVFMTRHNYANMQPMSMGDANNTQVWAMPLRYKDAAGVVRTMMFNNGGTMSPVMVDVNLQRICNTTESIDGFPTYDYVLNIGLAADFGIAPCDNSKTGIVQIDAV